MTVVWLAKSGLFDLPKMVTIISSFCHFSRIHFRIFAISVKTSSIFKTFFFAYASFFFKAKLLLLYFLLLLFTVHFEGFSLRLHFGLDFWRNQPEGLRDWIPYSVVEKKKKEIKLAEKVAKHARTHYPQMLTINLTYVQLYSTIFSTKTKKTQNVKTKNSNNVFKMIVYHLVQSVQQCLCNECVSFQAKTYVSCRYWK